MCWDIPFFYRCLLVDFPIFGGKQWSAKFWFSTSSAFLQKLPIKTYNPKILIISYYIPLESCKTQIIQLYGLPMNYNHLKPIILP